MKRTAGLRTVVVLAALALTVTACGSDAAPAASGATGSASAQNSSSPASAAASDASGIDCSQAGDLNATAETQPPADLPLVPGGKLYLSKGPFGKTLLFFEAVDADPADLDTPRDKAAQQLVDAGYKLDRKDQEEGSEAEAHLSGPHDVAIQVIQLCKGKVRIKYTLSS